MLNDLQRIRTRDTVNSNGGKGAAYAFVRPTLGTNSLLVGSAGGSSSVVLAYDGVWTATSNDSFLHISAGSASATGGAVVVFTYDAFTGTGSRTGTLTIAGLTVTVTQAGTNYSGPLGSNPLLTLASLPGALSVAADGSGNVYFSAFYSAFIDEWNASTQVTTPISPLVYPYDIALDSSGNIYMTSWSGNIVAEWNALTQQTTTLVSSGLGGPTGIAVDSSGNVYIADTVDDAIKEWSASTQQVTTLVSSGLNWPEGAAVDGLGNVYIADSDNGAVKEWNVATQQMTTLVSSGLNYPDALAVDGSGNVYIADFQTIKEWSPSTQQVTLLSSRLSSPSGVAVDASGNVYVANYGFNDVIEIPYAFVGPAGLTEPAAAGTDSLLPVLPAAAPLTGVYAPTSDQSWLTIGTVANGVVSFSFTANTSTTRVAHISLLGQQITVMQNGASNGSATQTISFGPLASQPFGTGPFALGATASSGLPVTFTSSTPGICTVSGAAVTLVSLGICNIQATQAGNIDYASAAPVNQSFEVTLGAQTIYFAPLPDRPFGSAPFTISAKTSSGLGVNFTSTTPGVCTLSCQFGGWPSSPTCPVPVKVTLIALGTCTIQATAPGEFLAYAPAAPVSQSFQVTPSVTKQVADAVFRDNLGAIQLSTYASSTLSDAGGEFASDPSAAQDVNGNTLVTARDDYDSIWANVYNPTTSAWSGWQSGGGIMQGVPSIAVDTSGTGWIAARDAYNSYWLVSFTTGNGFGAWIPLEGIFSTDPVVTACGDGSIYLIGKDNWNSLWSGQYIPGSGFQGWVFGGGIVAGKPAATCGTDNAVYVVAEDNWNSNWMVRVTGNVWGYWNFGGAITSVTPRIATLGTGSQAVVILDSSGVVWRTTYTEGPLGSWQPWVQVGGILSDVAPAGVGGELYLAGKSPTGYLWWWQQAGNQWTWIGNNGVAAGALAAAPK